MNEDESGKSVSPRKGVNIPRFGMLCVHACVCVSGLSGRCRCEDVS